MRQRRGEKSVTVRQLWPDSEPSECTISGVDRFRARTRPLEGTAMDPSGVEKRGNWDFPGGLCFRCGGHGFDPRLGMFHTLCSGQKIIIIIIIEWRDLDVSQVVTKTEHAQDDNRIQDE